jgi:mono/diheme cytochrome c family protein
MRQRVLVSILSIASLVVLFVQPVTAGGWAVVTLKSLPTGVTAGEPVTVAFQVMQHGVHPLQLEPNQGKVVARHLASGEQVEFAIQPTETAGHYTTVLTFPQSGVWSWAIHPGWFHPAAMPNLTVSGPVAKAPAVAPVGWWQELVVQLSSLFQPRVQAAPVAPAAVPLDQVAYGKALFQAKGCVTCHLHAEVPASFSVEVGPNLTNYQVIPEYVETRLKDPKAINPEAKMPQLPLTKVEIDALIAFLSAE